MEKWAAKNIPKILNSIDQYLSHMLTDLSLPISKSVHSGIRISGLVLTEDYGINSLKLEYYILDSNKYLDLKYVISEIKFKYIKSSGTLYTYELYLNDKPFHQISLSTLNDKDEKIFFEGILSICSVMCNVLLIDLNTKYGVKIKQSLYSCKIRDSSIQLIIYTIDRIDFLYLFLKIQEILLVEGYQDTSSIELVKKVTENEISELIMIDMIE